MELSDVSGRRGGDMCRYSIVEQMAPSPEQRPAIESRGADVVVTAGAGAGKTRTLVARYLSLLAEGIPLRSIVAVTFTKKAAREMRNRVREEIRRFLERQYLDLPERERWLAFYSELDAARIDTIHGLCGEVLRAHPAEARVDPRFEVLDEGQTGILRSQAKDAALAWAADDPQAVTLFALLGEGELRQRLAELMARRLDAQDAFDRMPADLAVAWRDGLHLRQALALADLLAGPDWQGCVDTLRTNQARTADDRIEIQRRLALASLALVEDARGNPEDQLAGLARLDAINLQGGSARAWSGGAAQCAEVKAAVRTLRDLWRGRPCLLQCKWGPPDDHLVQAMPGLRRLFDVAGEQYAALKEARRALDFDDLESGALALLRDHADVRERWQRDVQAVLVDEYQDTNGRQRDLVNRLNGGRGRLLIVGDAKQSIYRFRGADVSVFRSERKRIECHGEAFVLVTSYRAHRQLIDGLNDLLRPVMGETVSPARPWYEPFAALVSHRLHAAAGFAAPHIELHLTVGAKSGGALERAANALVGRIVALVESGACQTGTQGAPRALAYGDIAILCRSSGAFGAYEDALEHAGVPYLTVSGRGFYDRPEIRDLLNALRALADPSDDLALAGLLRSPAFAMSDAALYGLSEQRRQLGEDHPLATAAAPLRPLPRPCDNRGLPQGTTAGDYRTQCLWGALQQTCVHVPAEERPSAARAARIIAHLHNQVGRTTVADLLKAFLDTTNYPAALLKAGLERAGRNVAKLLVDAHSAGIVGVGEFLEYIGNVRDVGAREGEARAASEGAVQIMTVHAAKGLEFPVVVIGDITHSQGGARPLLFDPDLGVVPCVKDATGAKPAVYVMAEHLALDQEAAESDRLLYVAATRAQEKLILSGCILPGTGGTLGKMEGWLARLCDSGALTTEGDVVAHDPQGAATLCLDWRAGQTPVAGFVYEPGVQPVVRMATALPPSDGVGCLPPPLLGSLHAMPECLDGPTAEQERRPPRRVWRVVPRGSRPTPDTTRDTPRDFAAPRWLIGLLVHEALAVWRFPDGDFGRWAEARARSHGLTLSEQLRDAAHQARRLLERFQRCALYRTMDGAERRLHEVPYSVEANGRIELGRIDALYLREGGWTVVEFKTDRLKDEAERAELLQREDYPAQLGRYAAAVERLLGQRPQVVLCLLDFAGGVRLEAKQ